jgi:hypothetical protein
MNCGCVSPRETAPTRIYLRSAVIVTIGTVKLTALHTALLETGVQSRTGSGRCDRVSRSILSRHRAPIGHRASLEPRSGNPRRRFDVRSKAVEGVLILVVCHTASL